MHRLRHATFLRRFAVLWFALSVFAAAASPLVSPMSLQIVCSGTSIKVIVDDGDGPRELGAGSMDCALCLPTALPMPVADAAEPPPASPLAYVTRAIPAARLASLTAAPLPARGPPLHA